MRMTRTDPVGRDIRRQIIVIVAMVALVWATAGCGSDENEASEQALAEKLVAATQAAGVAPRLTVDTAESLYGTDAEAVCKAFDGELSTSAKNQLLGRFGLNRRKTITDHAVTYGGLVIDTYCPEARPRYDEVVTDLDPFERNAS
jgi:hypothetical protein